MGMFNDRDEDGLPHIDRNIDPNAFYSAIKKRQEIKKKVEVKKKQDEARQKVVNDRQKLQQQMDKKGVQSAQQKTKFEDLKKAEDIKKAQEDAAGPEQVSSQI